MCGQNPDLGVPTPRPPVEERNAAPQTPLRKVRFVGGGVRRSLYSRIQLGQIDCVLNLAGGQRSLDRLSQVATYTHSG